MSICAVFERSRLWIWDGARLNVGWSPPEYPNSSLYVMRENVERKMLELASINKGFIALVHIAHYYQWCSYQHATYANSDIQNKPCISYLCTMVYSPFIQLILSSSQSFIVGCMFLLNLKPFRPSQVWAILNTMMWPSTITSKHLCVCISMGESRILAHVGNLHNLQIMNACDGLNFRLYHFKMLIWSFLVHYACENGTISPNEISTRKVVAIF